MLFFFSPFSLLVTQIHLAGFSFLVYNVNHCLHMMQSSLSPFDRYVSFQKIITNNEFYSSLRCAYLQWFLAIHTIEQSGYILQLYVVILWDIGSMPSVSLPLPFGIGPPKIHMVSTFQMFYKSLKTWLCSQPWVQMFGGARWVFKKYYWCCFVQISLIFFYNIYSFINYKPLRIFMWSQKLINLTRLNLWILSYFSPSPPVY